MRAPDPVKLSCTVPSMIVAGNSPVPLSRFPTTTTP